MDPENHNKYNNHLLYNVDGEKSVMDLSEKADLKFEVSLSYLEQLHESGVIEKRKLTYKE